jgi:Smg protein
MFDVIAFLIDNYFAHGNIFLANQSATTEMFITFPKIAVQRTISWLEDLEYAQKNLCNHKQSPISTGMTFRYYSPHELNYLGSKAVGFISYLESAGILANQSRELLIDRLLAVDKTEITIKHIKWVTLIVLLNSQPTENFGIHLIQELINSDNVYALATRQ